MAYIIISDFFQNAQEKYAQHLSSNGAAMVHPLNF